MININTIKTWEMALILLEAAEEDQIISCISAALDNVEDTAIEQKVSIELAFDTTFYGSLLSMIEDGCYPLAIAQLNAIGYTI